MAAHNTVTDTIKVGVNLCGVAVAPDGRRLNVISEGSSTVSVIETLTDTVTATITTNGPPGCVAVAPAGRVYISDRAGMVSVIDPARVTTPIRTFSIGADLRGSP